LLKEVLISVNSEFEIFDGKNFHFRILVNEYSLIEQLTVVNKDFLLDFHVFSIENVDIELLGTKEPANRLIYSNRVKNLLKLNLLWV
jgi:hypothetical protein